MDDVAEAQKLFGEYERTGNLVSLDESIDVLNSLVEERGPSSPKAENFRQRIFGILDQQLTDIVKGYHFDQFVKGPVNDKTLFEVFYQVITNMSKEDAERTIKIMKIIYPE